MSQIDPPAHLLADGTAVRLPPPDASVRAASFANTVARHGLIRADTSSGDGGGADKSKQEGDGSAENKKAKADGSDAPRQQHTRIHPLAPAPPKH